MMLWYFCLQMSPCLIDFVQLRIQEDMLIHPDYVGSVKATVTTLQIIETFVDTSLAWELHWTLTNICFYSYCFHLASQTHIDLLVIGLVPLLRSRTQSTYS